MNDRVERTKTNIQVNQDPSFRTQTVARAIPEADTSEITGLQGLTKALSGFFGTVGSVSEKAMDADFAIQRQEAVDRNKDRTEQAEADVAMLPRNPDGKLTLDQLPAEKVGFKAYQQAASKALGIRNGNDLWQAFQDHIKQQPLLDTDYEGQKDAFLKRELQNGSRVGTGDPTLDGYMLHTFNQKALAFGEKYANEQFKGRIIKSENDRLAAFAEQVADPGFGAHHIQEAISDLQKINQLEPHLAPGRVLSALAVSAGNSPAMQQKLLALVNQPGSGPGGGVLAKQFPEGMQEFQDKLVKRYMSGKSFEGIDVYERLKSISNTEADVGRLATLRMWADQARSQYGEQGQYAGLVSHIEAKLAAAQKEELKFSQLDSMTRNTSANIDASLVKSHQLKYMQRLGIDPWSKPEAAADVIVRQRGLIDGDLKVELESALTQYNDPARTAAALRMVNGVVNGLDGNPESAKRIIGSDAYLAYVDAKRQMTYNRQDPAVMAEWLQKNKPLLQSDVGFEHWTGSKPAEAEKSVMDRIDSELSASWFSSGSTVYVDPSVKADMAALVKQTLLNRSRGAEKPDWKLAVKDVVEATKANTPVFPGQGNSLMVARTLMPREVPVLDDRGQPRSDGKGGVLSKPLVPFGYDVPNPENPGQTENTVKTFRTDMDNLFKQNTSGSFVNDQGVEVKTDSSATTITSKNWSVNGNSRLALKGYWMVEDEKANPVVLAKGHTYDIAGQRITIPHDSAEASKVLGAIGTGDGRISLIPYDWGYAVAYRPGFTNRAPTAAEREANYKPPPKREVTGPSEFDNFNTD